MKPDTVTLYVDKNRLADPVIANRLKNDPKGNVETLERFWPRENGFGEGDAVNLVFIYTDLVAIGERRTMETVRMIYEQHLHRFFGED